LSKILDKSHLFTQNEPNFHKAHNELNSIPEKDLRKIFTPPENEKQTQFKPNANPITENPKMNLTPYKKSNYVKYMTFSPQKNEPKTNPIQTQFSSDPSPSRVAQTPPPARFFAVSPEKKSLSTSGKLF